MRVWLCTVVCWGASALSLPAAEPAWHLVMIGGIDSDPTPAQLAGTARLNEGNSGLYQLARQLAPRAISVEYFNWNGTRGGEISRTPAPGARGISREIRDRVERQPNVRLAIVGNSWGGHTAWEVCQDLLQDERPLAVEHVVFLDPSSLGRGRQLPPRELPRNVNRATNYFTRNKFGWRKWIQDRRLAAVDLGDPDNGFLRDGRKYDAPFDFQAHVAAEWDDRIHTDLTERILTPRR